MTLSVQSISKTFGDFNAVDDISFELSEGRMLGFLGRNGAGKTTTFRMILGLLKPTYGKVTYKGQKVDKHLYDSIGYLPEERGLHTKHTVEEELVYLATLKGMPKKEIKKALDVWLERFEVTEHRTKKIEALSKGNQQKIQLLASLIHKPELLILDEPFSGLDPVNVELLKKAVIELNEAGTTIIFSSHRMDHVEELCDDVAIINKGQLVVSGSIKDVKNDFGHKKIVIEGEHTYEDLEALPGVVDLSQSKRVTEVLIEDEAVADQVFQAVVAKGYVKRFQVIEPSLTDIFIQKVGEVHE
ncbi:ABC transporter ATP-binding protein [Staphylococcus massiliensis]|uniref:ABC transporter ATP-binding protein n=1 Tax=Staphylococcus massiliensis TaxID=555791 RepID=UPI001EDE4D5B|nr:ABC transporter ATP-binding protein [Staphylococcus massiliensis]MCG3402439.1 ABC transporter ATP-binding protein [Staphylococcus massiliensis]